ncbi:MAG: aminotransferase class V-fold PLP-dependent enzyme [Planctomycetota bacterium]
MSTVVERDVTNDQHWLEFSNEWLIRPDTTYLNHGSFGPSPNIVRQQRRQWIDQLDCQPMDFYCRQIEPALVEAREKLANFVGTKHENLVFVENATFGMNVVADSFPLNSGEEILLNNHEYGAVHRIWERACLRSNANLTIAQLPEKFESKQQVIDCLLNRVTPKTRAVVISHITSATAIVMPVKELCEALSDSNVAIIIDGPHAPAQIDVDLESIGCDFYTASCHKWLSAPLGSGLLFVHPKHQSWVQPQLMSWGRLRPAVPETWDEEFTWSGTRDPSNYLTVPTAIDFLRNQVGLENFRNRSQFLATNAEKMLVEELRTEPIASRKDGWYASMAHVPLPPGDHDQLQKMLWDEYKIEVPIFYFDEKWYVRVSCHLYNNQTQLETLRFALRKYLV